MKLATGEFDGGIQTSEDARFYAYSSKFTPAFSSVGKDLVLQFSAKHSQKIDCGGGYIKVMSADLDQAKFNGDSEYFIMFGPDICGTTTKRVHVIFNYNGQFLSSNHAGTRTAALEHRLELYGGWRRDNGRKC